MKNLFGAEGAAALALAMRSAPLLAFDFDGTLAPIVAHPDDARVTPEISRRLALLARHFPLAIVTGRGIADVAQRLGFEPRYIVGNHGAEDRDSAIEANPDALDSARALLARFDHELAAAGVWVEDKRYSLALHYRGAADVARAVRLVERLRAQLDPAVRAFGGKQVTNIVPSSAPDKGDAVAALLHNSRCGWVVFVGDDVGDEAAFAKAESNWLTVRVGADFAASRAAYFVEGHERIRDLLDRMIEAIPGIPIGVAYKARNWRPIGHGAARATGRRNSGDT